MSSASGRWRRALRRMSRWARRVADPMGVAEFWPLLKQVNQLEPRMMALSDSELAAKTTEFKGRLARGEMLEELLAEAYAVVREVARRQLGMRHFDVQVLGGIALHSGCVAEMKTGEGKTLVATLPLYLNALSGQGVHLITVNDYLAARDAEWMGPIYRFLGLTVGVVLEDAAASSEREERRQRRQAYASDITYGTNHEFVFDYLRDNLAIRPEERVQRGQYYAIVDEVDFLLIDEVRTPLIISGPGREDTRVFVEVDRVVRRLRPEVDYRVESRTKTASLTEQGSARVEAALGRGNLCHLANLEWFHAVHQSLLAHGAYQRDVDYIVRNRAVQIVDEFTGRVTPDKRYSGGLHQAIEAKEGVRVRPEDRTFARMSYQNYFRLYRKIAGMTGTAASVKDEFRTTYGMRVVVVPTHRPMIRDDYEDVVLLSLREKHEAIASEIALLRARGQPVLVGTMSVEESEQLHRLLKKKGIVCHVLNAKNHRAEAAIVAQAGRVGSVTISTNMAGRGTDIMLGGNPEQLCEAASSRAAGAEHREQVFQQCAREHDQVVQAGGLYVIGTSLHEARRIDDQLRGRAGRQGDPGSSQFIISVEDEIFRKFGEREVVDLMAQRRNQAPGTPIGERSIRRLLESLREKVAIEHEFERRETLKYDLVVAEQRETIYRWRSALLETASDPLQARQVALELIDRVIQDLVEGVVNPPEPPQLPVPPDDMDLELADEFPPESVGGVLSTGADGALEPVTVDNLREAYSNVFAHPITLPPVLEGDAIVQTVAEQAQRVLQTREQRFGAPLLRELERQILLEIIDELWVDHLSDIERLEDGVGLMSYAEMDPYVVFRKMVGPMFRRLLEDIRRRSVALWFRIVPVREASAPRRAPHTGRRRKKRGR